MKQKWFVAKKYGFGWKPVTWQGWLVIISYLAITIYVFFQVDASSQSGSDTFISFAPYFVLLTGALILVCYQTGEKPSWKWGSSQENKKKPVSKNS